MIPPAWIAMCAGVQNESRPIDMCHEMSQYMPTTINDTEASDAHANQGNRSRIPGNYSRARAERPPAAHQCNAWTRWRP